MSPSPGLRGEIALVTGASSGIGRFAAGSLARAGVRVALVARRPEPLTEAVEEIVRAGGDARSYQLDVSRAGDVDDTVGRIWDDLGPISILVNNAGIYLLKDALSATAEDLDRLHAVNVRGSYLVAQAVGRRMIANRIAGRIVNLGSIAGLRPMPLLGVYGMSKASVIHMTKVLAREWGRHDINVCALSPGYFHTEMTDSDLQGEAGKKLVQWLPRRRIGKVEDLESTLLFLVDPRSRFVNGAIVPVDDGLTVA
jgi:NAD(P)-dependent dehydrogenase (short-subunit alcohol dehydrogenase family)